MPLHVPRTGTDKIRQSWYKQTGLPQRHGGRGDDAHVRANPHLLRGRRAGRCIEATSSDARVRAAPVEEQTMRSGLAVALQARCR